MTARHYAGRVATRVRADIDHGEIPLLLIADLFDSSVPEIQARCDGEIPWNTDELEILARLLGVDVMDWLGGER